MNSSPLLTPVMSSSSGGVVSADFMAGKLLEWGRYGREFHYGTPKSVSESFTQQHDQIFRMIWNQYFPAEEFTEKQTQPIETQFFDLFEIGRNEPTELLGVAEEDKPTPSRGCDLYRKSLDTGSINHYLGLHYSTDGSEKNTSVIHPCLRNHGI